MTIIKLLDIKRVNRVLDREENELKEAKKLLELSPQNSQIYWYWKGVVTKSEIMLMQLGRFEDE